MDIKQDVKSIIATQSGVAVEQVKLACELRKQPLTFDDFGLIYLASALRAYVKQHTHNTQTVTKSEISKSECKVSDVIELIEKKMEASR